jgi:hypothetical protein
MSPIPGVVRRHPWRVGSVLTGLAVVIFALLYFAPQDLLLDTYVNEPVPTAAAAAPTASHGTRALPVRPAPQVLARGRFSSGEHATSGTALLLRLSDGRVFVRLQHLSTSNGPAVRIWLSSAPAPSSNAAVKKGASLDLGGLKGNQGNQNYPVPSGAALAEYRSVVIWCNRFDVVFGSAPLT